MAAIRISLSVFDNAPLDQVLLELKTLTDATQSEQTVNYNGKWLKAEPGDDVETILRRYAGEKQIATVTPR